MRVPPLLLLGVFILVVGCSRKAVPSTTTEVRDSIVYREVPRIIRDTVPGEMVVVKERIECDPVTNRPKPKIISGKTGRASVDVNISSTGELTVAGGCDSLIRIIQAKDQIIERYRVEKREEVRPEIIYETHWYDKAARWIASFTLACWLAAALYVILKLKSKIA